MIENGQCSGGFVLCYGGDRIPFQVSFHKRRTLGITVHPDTRVEVLAPAGSALEQVLARVERRASWIIKQRRYFEQFQPTLPRPRFVSGETHLYLGRQYRLKVQAGTPRGVKLVGRFLHVFVREQDDPAEVQALLEEWYRAHAKRVFAHRLQMCLKASRSLVLPTPPSTIIRKLTKRWGSCTKKGNVLLNLDLVPKQAFPPQPGGW